MDYINSLICKDPATGFSFGDAIGNAGCAVGGFFLGKLLAGKFGSKATAPKQNLKK